MLPLSQQDHLALEQHGLSLSKFEAQLKQFQQGISPLCLVRPCHVEDGIIQLNSEHIEDYHKKFQIAHAQGRISKFIPASGAATRMFKNLLQFLEKGSSSRDVVAKDSSLSESVIQSWEQLHQFPFIEDLKHYFKITGMNFQSLHKNNQMKTVFQALLHFPGLGYANFPKALLPFHRYSDGIRTSLEEHVHEAMMYAPKGTNLIRTHLTVSAQFEEQVKAHIKRIQQKITQSGVKLEVTVSIQKPSTDTIALDSQGQPFRNDNGQLVFRPGGHGALLENLNDYRGDIVCISNIDNVAPDHLKASLIQWRMSMAGYLIALQETIFQHLKQLELPQPTIVEQAEAFVRDHLHSEFPQSEDGLDYGGKAQRLKQFLDRPIRVCGVVPNTGDPGGGPFWVQHSDGSLSRQIVEQSQADPQSESHQQLFASATHFNPVDIVCGVRNHQGNPFNLLSFRDPETSFISHKTYEGRPLTALEWPGLWNGGMAKWITIFVEVPRSTFNPVKTFLDWLRPNHQPLA